MVLYTENQLESLGCQVTVLYKQYSDPSISQQLDKFIQTDVC